MHDGILCMHDGILCMHDGILCMYDMASCLRMMAYCACMMTCWIHDDKLCMHDDKLCMHDGRLCMHDGIMCMHDGIMCMHDGKLCMHGGMVDPENAIDMLGMLCTLNIKFDTIHRPYRNVLGNWLHVYWLVVSGFGCLVIFWFGTFTMLMSRYNTLPFIFECFHDEQHAQWH